MPGLYVRIMERIIRETVTIKCVREHTEKDEKRAYGA
jgi:hypothetical protein